MVPLTTYMYTPSKLFFGLVTQRHLFRALRDVLGCTGDFDHSSLGNVNGIKKLSEMRMNK